MKRIIALIIIALAVMMLASCLKKEKGGSGDLFNKVLSADEALAEAKKTDTVVLEDNGVTSGKDVWDSFYSKASKGKKASVLCAHYYTLDEQNISEELYEQEKDEYPVLYFYLIEFDGQQYHIKTRDSKSTAIETDETFKCLLHFTGKCPSTAIYEDYEYYILADDEALTYEQLEKSLFSSQSTDFIRHYFVYSNYSGLKEG